MIFFSVLFTLDGRDSKENLYVHMLLLLFKSMQYKSTFSGRDSFYIMTDSDTAPLIPSSFKIVIMPKPKTVLEGISWRYEFFDHIQYSEDETYQFLDLDMLNSKPFLLNLTPDTIAVFPEGSADDSNYTGDMGHLDHPGLSAGFWAIRPGPRTLKLLMDIRHLIQVNIGKNFYTVEQPMFNQAIKGGLPYIVYFSPTTLSFNGHTNKGTAHWLNMCGVPGDDRFHFDKMLRMFLTLA